MILIRSSAVKTITVNVKQSVGDGKDAPQRTTLGEWAIEEAREKGLFDLLDDGEHVSLCIVSVLFSDFERVIGS